MANDVFSVVDVGTSTVRVLAGEICAGSVSVLSESEIAHRGIKKGVIIDYEGVHKAVQVAIEDAENKADVTFMHVFLSVSGGKIRSDILPAHVSVLNSDKSLGAEVTQSHVDRVCEIARSFKPPEGKVLLESNQLAFNLDARSGIENPIGMEGHNLTVKMVNTYCDSTKYDELKKLLQEDFDLICDEIMFTPTAAACALLTEEQKEAGIAILDLGAGTTDISVYGKGNHVFSHSFPIGGDHVTNDISSGLNLTRKQSESLKIKYGAAMMDLADNAQTVPVPVSAGYGGGAIKTAGLLAIINARMEELFEVIKDKLDEKGLSNEINMGFILIGGGANLKGVEGLASRVFFKPVKCAEIRDVKGLSSTMPATVAASLIGAVRYQSESLARQEEANPLKRFLKKLGL